MIEARSTSLTAFLFALAILSGCSKSADNGASSDDAAHAAKVESVNDSKSIGNPGNAADTPLTQAWIGRWTGPEGLFLDIQPAADGKSGHYALTNKDNLDRQGDYAGIAEGTTIRFVRDGKNLAIRPGSGRDTGFKWLAEKKECLIVMTGREGYCR